MHCTQGTVGSQMDLRPPFYLRWTPNCFRCSWRYLLLWFFRERILVEEAWLDAWSYLLEWAHLPRRRHAHRLCLLALRSLEEATSPRHCQENHHGSCRNRTRVFDRLVLSIPKLEQRLTASYRRAPSCFDWHELEAHEPVYWVCCGSSPRRSWEPQGLQRHQSIRLYGHDLSPRQDKLLREARQWLRKSWCEPKRYQDQGGKCRRIRNGQDFCLLPGWRLLIYALLPFCSVTHSFRRDSVFHVLQHILLKSFVSLSHVYRPV